VQANLLCSLPFGRGKFDQSCRKLTAPTLLERLRFHMRLPWKTGVVGLLARGGSAIMAASDLVKAWFKKCHFQVTPKIDKALVVKGLLVLGVTLS